MITKSLIATAGFIMLAATPHELPTLAIGDALPKPEVAMMDVTNKEVTLKQAVRSNGLLVVFICNSCPFVVGSDGSEGWEGRYPALGQLCQQNNIGFVLVNSNEAKRDGDDSFVEMQAHYKAKGYTVEYIGKEDLEGTEVHKIKIVKSPTKTEYALIDPENWYQIKNITVATVDGKEITAETMYSNFKKDGELVFPYTIEQNNPMMGTSVTTVTALKLNEPVDEKIFDMPAKK